MAERTKMLQKNSIFFAIIRYHPFHCMRKVLNKISCWECKHKRSTVFCGMDWLHNCNCTCKQRFWLLQSCGANLFSSSISHFVITFFRGRHPIYLVNSVIFRNKFFFGETKAECFEKGRPSFLKPRILFNCQAVFSSKLITWGLRIAL